MLVSVCLPGHKCWSTADLVSPGQAAILLWASVSPFGKMELVGVKDLLSKVLIMVLTCEKCYVSVNNHNT